MMLRRRVLLAGAGLAAAAVLPTPARAARQGVVVYCDHTLAPLLRRLGRRFAAAPVSVFAAAPAALLALIARQVQDDVLFTLVPVMAAAAAQRLISATTRIDGWRNALVLAAPAGTAPVGDAALAGWLAARRVAVTDPTAMASFDGQAVLRGLGVPSARVLGAANTDEVRALVVGGAAEAGLLYRTDVADDPRLTQVALLSRDEAAYAAALATTAVSPHAQAFLDFLRMPAAAAALRDGGLDVA